MELAKKATKNQAMAKRYTSPVKFQAEKCFENDILLFPFKSSRTGTSSNHATNNQQFDDTSQSWHKLEPLLKEANGELTYGEASHENHLEPKHATKRLVRVIMLMKFTMMIFFQMVFEWFMIFMSFMVMVSLKSFLIMVMIMIPLISFIVSMIHFMIMMASFHGLRIKRMIQSHFEWIYRKGLSCYLAMNALDFVQNVLTYAAKL